jgi:hypothetical protein
MSEQQKSREERVVELRQQWLRHAAAAFDLMFHPEHQADLVSLDQRETRACESVDDLKAWLLNQHLASDADACPAADQPVNCPHCHKPARRVEPPDKPTFRRDLTTLCGEVRLKRAKFSCATCRVAFFPSGPQARPGR